MAKCARTNKDSSVWDKAMGSAGFLVSAMDLMIKDCPWNHYQSDDLDEENQEHQENQLLGIEILLGNIYILAVLNMILMGDGCHQFSKGDSHEYLSLPQEFPANVFLILLTVHPVKVSFVEEAFNQMINGYGTILIQDSAGNGQGLPYTKRILQTIP